MKNNRYIKLISYKAAFIAGLLLYSFLSVLQAQEIIPVSDSAKVVTIPLERIPIKSGETSIKISRLTESLIKEERIAAEKAINDSIISVIDSLLLEESNTDLQLLNERYLNNRKSYWTEYQSTIEKQKSKLSGLIKTLNDKKNTLEKEYKLWNDTRKSIDPEETASSISDIIDEITTSIDSVNKIIVLKTNEIIKILESATKSGLDIEDLTNKIKSILNLRKEEIFAKTHPSVFEIDYAHSMHWDLNDHVVLFYDTDLKSLGLYYKNNSNRFYFYILLLVILIVLFYSFRKRIARLDMDLASSYQRTLRGILMRPLSAALTVGLFATVLMFPNRPPIFIDISILLVAIPLLDIVWNATQKRSHIYIIIFGILLFVRFLNYIFPPEIILHRLLIAVIAIIEIITLISLSRYFRQLKLSSRIFHTFVRIIIIIHILIAAVGLIANLFGNITMARMAVSFAVSNTFIGLLVIVSAAILIGLIHFAVDGEYLRRLNFIRRHGYYIKKRTVGLVMLVATLFWLDATLGILGIDSYVYEFFDNLLITEYGIGSASFTIGSLVLFFFVIWLSVIISNIIRVVLEDDILYSMKLKKGVPRMISVMVRFTIITTGIFLAISAVGMPLDQMAIIFGAFSVGIGFGLQNIFNNLVSGVILLFERPIQIDDAIEVGALIGRVKSMGIRSSNIRTFDGAEVIVPNGMLISNEVVNWTLSDKRRRIEIISGVAYGSDVHKVKKLFLEILNTHPDIIQEPEPLVLFNDLGESSLDFRLLFWTDRYEDWILIRSEIVFKVHDVLYEHGISIPFPQRDLHIKSVDGKIDPKKDLPEPPEKKADTSDD